MNPVPKTKSRCANALLVALTSNDCHKRLWFDYKLFAAGYDHPCFAASANASARANTARTMRLKNSARWLRREQHKTERSCIFCNGSMGNLHGRHNVMRMLHKFWGH